MCLLRYPLPRPRTDVQGVRGTIPFVHPEVALLPVYERGKIVRFATGLYTITTTSRGLRDVDSLMRIPELPHGAVVYSYPKLGRLSKMGKPVLTCRNRT